MRITIEFRLGLLVGAGVLAVGIVGATSFAGSSHLDQSAGRMAAASTAMSAQWNADMLHDTLRADTLAALYATTDEQRQQFEVDAVSEHAADMTSLIAEASAGAPPELADDYAQASALIDEYGAAAVKIVGLAATDRAGAEALLPRFMDLFSQLEELLGSIDEDMLAFVTSHEDAAAATARTSLVSIIVTSILAAVLFGLLALWVRRALIPPLRVVVSTLAAVADGDLTRRVGFRRRDELGDLSDAVDRSTAAMEDLVHSLTDTSTRLATTSEQLSHSSGLLSSTAAGAASTGGMAAQQADGVSRTVASLAAATHELGASIGEISQSSGRAVHVAQTAVTEAAEASATVARLGESSTEIGNVVKVITAIAEQTNLLALNATIEAARAGEAGKGFAVVAEEVKQLAQETARATEEISRRVEAIQADTEGAVTVIDRVSAVIEEINSHQTAIAAAVEEQTATTAEMARAVRDAADGAGEIALRIGEVAVSANSTTSAADETHGVAQDLARLSGTMRDIATRFRTR
jgi:methyl-accepting chemotaxis protein